MRKTTMLVATGLLLLALVGCSKDSKTETGGSATSAPAGQSSDEKSTSDEKSSDEKSSDEKSSGGGGGDCPSQSEVDEINTVFDDAFMDSAADPNEAMNQMLDAIDQMGEYVPDDLQSDWETLREGIEKLAEVMGSVDLNDPSSLTPEKIAEMEAVTAELEDPKYTEAADNLEAYFMDACPDINFGS